jgi:hypothetical protein
MVGCVPVKGAPCCVAQQEEEGEEEYDEEVCGVVWFVTPQPYSRARACCASLHTRRKRRRRRKRRMYAVLFDAICVAS